jgi:hypothetical protein
MLSNFDKNIQIYLANICSDNKNIKTNSIDQHNELRLITKKFLEIKKVPFNFFGYLNDTNACKEFKEINNKYMG